LNEEEEKVKEDIKKKYFGDMTDKALFVKGMIESGEIKPEEAWETLENMTGLNNAEKFWGFMAELKESLNCTIAKGTKLDKVLVKPQELDVPFVEIEQVKADVFNIF